MTTEMTAPVPPVAPANASTQQLRCALTGVPVTAEEAYWAPPLITARELVTTVAKTAVHAPGALGSVLMAEQANVPYAPSAREQLAGRRSAEQAKLLMLLLVVLAILVVPILLFVV